MAGDDSTRDDFKLKQKERARLARKAAYAQQKARMQERKTEQKADPEYKKTQLQKRAEQKQRYKDFKAKHKRPMPPMDDAEKREKRADRQQKDKTVFASLKLAKDIHKNLAKFEEPEDTIPGDVVYSNDDDSPYIPQRPKLRLVKSDDCD